MMRILVGAVALTLTALAAADTGADAAAEVPLSPPQLSLEHRDAIRQAVGASSRSITNVMRDAHRHPDQTLIFFAVKPEHKVIEVWPGEGWYSEILAPLLYEEGKLIAAHFDPDSEVEYFRDSLKAYQGLLQRPRSGLDRVELAVLNYEPEQAITTAGSVDRVLTFRNVHNWLAAGKEPAQQVFDKFHAALKPGGILGVVEHRGRMGMSLEEMVETGYVSEELVIELAGQAGFELLARSPINQNSKDTADHPEGVWTLPPTLRLGDENRAQYLAIGESDRMTLMFIKP